MLVSRGRAKRKAEAENALQKEINEMVERISRTEIKDESDLKRIEEKFVSKPIQEHEHEAKQACYNALNREAKPTGRKLVIQMERERALNDDILYLGKNIDEKLAKLHEKGIVSEIKTMENGSKRVMLTYPKDSQIEKIQIEAQTLPEELPIFSEAKNIFELK